MKGRDLVGKRVVAVRQTFWRAADGAHVPGWVLDSIEFDDGTELTFVVAEGEDSYGVEGIVTKCRRER